MSKTVALINVYNDCQFIAACIESIKNHVDEIVIADGAYELYYRKFKQHHRWARPWSTDGTLEIIRALRDLPKLTIIRCTKPWVNQVEKRTALLDHVKTGDWFIIIDADEMLLGDVETGMREIKASGCITARVPLVNLGADIDRLHYFWHPRIFRKEKGMHYELTHWHLRDYAGRIVETVYPVWWTQRFVMAHLKLLKRPGRLEAHQDYMMDLQAKGWLEPLREELRK